MAFSGYLGDGADAKPAPALGLPLRRLVLRVLAVLGGAVAALLVAAAAASADDSGDPVSRLTTGLTGAVQHQVEGTQDEINRTVPRQVEDVRPEVQHRVRDVVRRTVATPQRALQRVHATVHATVEATVRAVTPRKPTSLLRHALATNRVDGSVAPPRVRADHAPARHHAQPRVVAPDFPASSTTTAPTTLDSPTNGAVSRDAPGPPDPPAGPASGSQDPLTLSGSNQHPSGSAATTVLVQGASVERAHIAGPATADPVDRAGPVELRPA